MRTYANMDELAFLMWLVAEEGLEAACVKARQQGFPVRLV